MSGGKVPIGTWFGVPVWLHLSWVIVFFLVWFVLGATFYPAEVPAWSAFQDWAIGLVVTLLFFGTVLGHEFAHALVARWRGLHVKGITLNFLGGAAEIERDADQPLDELLISAAGPLSSFGFAGVFYVLAWALAPERGLAVGAPGGLPGVAVSAGYLATINLWLAAFNSLPGFPLDGGRVLRALIWSRNQDFVRATQIAAQVGRVLAFGFIAFALLQFVRNRPADLWYLFVGWFLNNAAGQSYRQINVQAILRQVPVWRVMHTNFPWVQAGVPVRDLVFQYFADTSRPDLPVIADGAFVGMLSRTALRGLHEATWATTPASRLMTPVAALPAVAPTDDTETALRRLQSAEVALAPVLHEGRLVGLLSEADVVGFLRARN